MSSRFQKSEEGTNFRHSVQGKNLSPCIWKGNFGNRPHDDCFSGDLPPRPECWTENSEPTKGEVIGIGMEDFYESRLWQILSMIFPK